MLHDKKILLTGGAGFIGTKIIERLANKNKIIIYDNFIRNSIKFVIDKLNNHELKIIKGDILNFAQLESVVYNEKPDVIIHLAAIAGVDTVICNPIGTLRTNIIGTYNVLEAVRKLNNEYIVDRFINISTSEVFGSYAFKVEEGSNSNLAPVGEARWTYAISKLTGEHFTYHYYKSFGIKTVTIRPFNIYGPGQVGEGAIHVFITKALMNQDILIHGDGDQIRSWCYIDDFVDGVLLCIEKQEAVGNIFNIGNPRGTITILMLAQLIKELTGSKSKIIHVNREYTDVELRIPSIEKSKRILGFIPKIDLVVGLQKTIEWYRSVLM